MYHVPTNQNMESQYTSYYPRLGCLPFYLTILLLQIFYVIIIRLTDQIKSNLCETYKISRIFCIRCNLMFFSVCRDMIFEFFSCCVFYTNVFCRLTFVWIHYRTYLHDNVILSDILR